MNTSSFDTHLAQKIYDDSKKFSLLKDEIAKIIIGNEEAVHFIIIALLCNGHVLLEGVPGVAKTTLIKAINDVLGLSFKRIQFTPDLLPSDLIGTLIFNNKTQEFETKKGPIFANLVLADEINRTPAKVQAALLEAMGERKVTIGLTTHELDRLFFVFATQNPIEQEGTYALPEAQIDRFMFKLFIDYLTPEQEKQIIRITASNHNAPSKIIVKEELLETQAVIPQIYVDPRIDDYIVSIIFATRKPAHYGLARLEKYCSHGASPRATLGLYRAAQAHAFLNERYFVIPEDIKAVAPRVLVHRLGLTYEAQADAITAKDLVREILKTIPSP